MSLGEGLRPDPGALKARLRPGEIARGDGSQSLGAAPRPGAPAPGFLTGDDKGEQGGCWESQELTKVLLCLARASARACRPACLEGRI